MPFFSAPVVRWFATKLGEPTAVQIAGWPRILRGDSALLVAPTGSGKTLAAFLAGLERLMFEPPLEHLGVRLLYVSPLKALAVDVERNLRTPLTGIAEAAGELGQAFRIPSLALRSGDTPAIERTRFRRNPTEILITTPESLYLLLTADSARHLASVETVIVDEVHALFGSKRGAHLALSLERLERLRRGRRLQRIGLSATVNPVHRAAQWLGGSELLADGRLEPRPVEVIDVSAKPRLRLRVEVPVTDMDRSGLPGKEASIWPAIYRPLIELIQRHRSTLVFVNSRGLAERLSAELNAACGQPLVLAHHGAVARERRLEIEEALKSGQLRGLVATSTLELGIDMGAIDLVVQIEAPPSVAAGLQRIGRAGHHVGGTSEGIIYPKYRGDLLAAAATVQQMVEANVEALHFPLNPLDVLAQQVVAIVSVGEIPKQQLYELVRRAAPYATLTETLFESVLDMLAGRYPADAFAELRPRINWDRRSSLLSARSGARHLAVVNGGTIPDRGLYSVYLTESAGKHSRRVGELDEEMVFESRVGDVFLLGASSWRIDAITHDRVLVSPAPGAPGEMPFWHGDRAGRPLALGKAVGRLTRELDGMSDARATAHLNERGLAPTAASNLVAYLRAQRQALGQVPSDEQIIVESFLDEVGDYRVCVLSPFGSRVHAPWALAAMELQRKRLGIETEAVWFDDGLVFRFPQAQPPQLAWLIPDPLELDELLQQGLLKSALFASHFRESAARALLLPRRRPGHRTPLWAQRRRAADLLRAASGYDEFPILLETMRECLSDVFDLPGLREILGSVQSGALRVTLAQAQRPSPFASALLFNYAGNFLYEVDAPLAERRAQALTVNQAQLRQLLGDAELRQLLDPKSIAEIERAVSRRDWRLRHADDLHDLLVAVGELDPSELRDWNESTKPASNAPENDHGAADAVTQWLDALEAEGRVVPIPIAGGVKYIAVEDLGRYRAWLPFDVPRDIAPEFLAKVRDPLGDLVTRYARTHGPFCLDDLLARYSIDRRLASEILDGLARRGRVTSGSFLPGGTGLEWCDVEVLRRIKRRSLERLRQQIQPVRPEAYCQFLLNRHGIGRARRGTQALLENLDRLQGTPVIASVFEQEILAARLDRYHPSDLDALVTSGELVWRGLGPVGPRDGRIALYWAEQYSTLAPCSTPISGTLADRVRELLRGRGASFFDDLQSGTRAFAPELLDTLWAMVWSGEVTNDSLMPLRSRLLEKSKSLRPRTQRTLLRRSRLPGSEGRWSLLERGGIGQACPSPTERLTTAAQQLLQRYGLVAGEVPAHDAAFSFSELYPVFKAMESAGKIRRGLFVEGLAPTQFADASAADELRLARDQRPHVPTVVLAATDPANPYGSILPWPPGATRLQRAAGAEVVLHEGALVAYLSRKGHSLYALAPANLQDQSMVEQAVARTLCQWAERMLHRGLEIREINGSPPGQTSLGRALVACGFSAQSNGLFYRGNLTRRTEEP